MRLSPGSSRSSTPATQLAQDVEIKRAMKVRARMVKRNERRELKLKALAGRPKSNGKSLAVLFRERRLAKVGRGSVSNLNGGVDEESGADDEVEDGAGNDDEVDGEDVVAAATVRKAVEFTAADGKVLIRIHKYVLFSFSRTRLTQSKCLRWLQGIFHPVSC